MSSIHYKLRSSLDYDTLTFDGPSISLSELREAIMLQKKFGKTSDLTLEITNAQTKEVYQDPSVMIPRNTSVVVKRVPIARLAAVTGKTIDEENPEEQNPKVSLATLNQTGDLANANASEKDKISAMMQQSNEQWQSDQYVNKMRPREYICFRCGQKGHYIRDCPTIGDPRYNQQQRFRGGAVKEHYMMQMKERERQTSVVPTKSIPTSRSYSPVVGSDVVGKKTVPVELQCPMCKKLLADAVVIPCCGTSYCDECIRNYLIDNEFACPSCKENTVPDNLIANKSLRTAVSNFRNSSHLPTPKAEENASKSPLHISTTPITIKLLKKEEPKPVKPEEKSEEKKSDPTETKNDEDALNVSTGPITDAQLFEEIVKQPVKASDAEGSDVKQAATKQSDVGETVKENAGNTESAAKPDQEVRNENDKLVSVQTSQAAQQPPQQHQAQLPQQLSMQQQPIVMKTLQVQPTDPQLQSAVAMQVQAPIMVQQIPHHAVSLPMVSNLNPVLPTQQIIVSGPQIIDQNLQTVVVSQAYHQRLVTPGVVNQAVAAPVLVRHAQPAAGISVSAAYHPTAVHSAVPNRLVVNSQLARTGNGHFGSRDAGSFGYIDPLFDVTPSDKTLPLVPMTEEEFYRAKLRLKDGGLPYKKQSRSRSRSRSKQRSRQPRSSRAKERSSRRKARHESHERHDSKRRSEKQDYTVNKQNKDWYRTGRKDKSRRTRRDKSHKNHQKLENYDGAEKEIIEYASRKVKHAGRSRSRSLSSNRQQKRDLPRRQKINDSTNRSESSDAWSRSPSPDIDVNQSKNKEPASKMKSVDADSEVDSVEFKTVKLDESKSAARKSQKSGKRNSENDSEINTKKKTRKRKSDDRQEETNVKMKKGEEKIIPEEIRLGDKTKAPVKLSTKAKKVSQKVKKTKNQTSQESSHVSDESATWDEILTMKNKKLKQRELRKRAQMEKPPKAKKQRKATKVEPQVEIKIVRPLVDVSTSHSESEVDARSKLIKVNEIPAQVLPEDQTIKTDNVVSQNPIGMLDKDIDNKVAKPEFSEIVNEALEHNSSNDGIFETKHNVPTEDNPDLDNATVVVAKSDIDTSQISLPESAQDHSATTELAKESDTGVSVGIDEQSVDSHEDRNSQESCEITSVEKHVHAASLIESINEILEEVLAKADVIVNPSETVSNDLSCDLPSMKPSSDEVEAMNKAESLLKKACVNDTADPESSAECLEGYAAGQEKENQATESAVGNYPKESIEEEPIADSDVGVSAQIMQTEGRSAEAIVTEQQSQIEEDSHEARKEEDRDDDVDVDANDENHEEGRSGSEAEKEDSDEDSAEEQELEESEDEGHLDSENGDDSSEQETEEGLSSEKELMEEDDAEESDDEGSVEEEVEESPSEKEDSDEEEHNDSMVDQCSGSENIEASNDSDEEQNLEEDSDEDSEDEQSPEASRGKNLASLNGERCLNTNADHSDYDSDDEKAKKKSRKEKKHKREKERKKRKRKRKYSEEEEEDSYSEDEVEPKKKKRKKSEKKARKHKRKHRKHRKSKKHRKSRKNEEDDSEDDERRSNKKVIKNIIKRVESDSDDHSRSKKRLKIKKGFSRQQSTEDNSDDNNDLVVEINRPTSKKGSKVKTRTIYVDKNHDDVRYIEAKKKTKTLRTVTGKRK